MADFKIDRPRLLVYLYDSNWHNDFDIIKRKDCGFRFI